MNILFIADNFPGLDSGGSARNYYILKSLAKNNVIDVIGLTDDKKQIKPIKFKNVTYHILERKPAVFFSKLRYISTGKIPYIEQRKNIPLPQEIREKISQYNLI